MTHGLNDLFRMTEPHEGPVINQPAVFVKCPDLSEPQI